MALIERGIGVAHRHSLSLAGVGVALVAAGAGLAAPPPFQLPIGWPSYGYIPQHVAVSPRPTHDLTQIVWQTPVDLDPQYSGSSLLIHYGSPLITSHNTVVVTVKTGAENDFRVEGHRASDGATLWMQDTDYIQPRHSWGLSCGSVLTPQGYLVTPGIGGTVYVRVNPDSPNSAVIQVAFYGIENYQADPAGYNAGLQITTPITSDSHGNIYFGYNVSGTLNLPIRSGIARISRTGVGTWISAADAAMDANIRQVPFNCAPGLSLDGSILYVAVRDSNAAGYLLGLDSATLAPLYSVHLDDVLQPNQSANLSNNGTASPTIGPDGDVYYGVLEYDIPRGNHDRGWLLHYNHDLTETKIPGAFGWDDTASIVPANAVPSYTGPSHYLLLTKYNNYAGAGGDGHNRIAILDPNVTEVDPISGATVMNEVITILGPTIDHEFGGDTRREWCINNAAVDRFTKSALVNNEDGILYRWDFTTNTLTQSVVLTKGVGEAYTPTVTGPDGTTYAINNGILFAVR